MSFDYFYKVQNNIYSDGTECRNGNLTTHNSNTYSWNYRNEMLESVVNNATSTYFYNHNGDRVKHYSSNASIYYPNKYYEYDASSGKTTARVYLLDQPIITGFFLLDRRASND